MRFKEHITSTRHAGCFCVEYRSGVDKFLSHSFSRSGWGGRWLNVSVRVYRAVYFRFLSFAFASDSLVRLLSTNRSRVESASQQGGDHLTMFKRPNKCGASGATGAITLTPLAQDWSGWRSATIWIWALGVLWFCCCFFFASFLSP